MKKDLVELRGANKNHLMAIPQPYPLYKSSVPHCALKPCQNKHCYCRKVQEAPGTCCPSGAADASETAPGYVCTKTILAFSMEIQR